MPLLLNAILILWISTVGVQAFSYCNFPKINHGIIYGKEKPEELLPISIGEIYYYSCEYNFASPSRSFWTRIICTEQGWSPTPKCLRLCFFPSVENGHSASSGQTHLEGDIVQIVCDVGYSLPDNSDTITCLEDGWSSPPKCSSTNIECLLPVLKANVDVYPRQVKYKAGDVLQFSCGQRLTRVGPDSVQCYYFGWSPNFPTCKGQVQSCGQPPQLPNGKMKAVMKEEYRHGETVEYDCPPYFLMTGPKKVQCIDGEWTNLPTCVGQVKACGSVPHLKDGYAQFSSLPLQHGVSVELSCRDTHTMIGNNVITCIDGMWTELPKCVETNQLKSCRRPILHTEMPMNLLVREYNHSARINYRCLGKVRRMQSICINGKWYPEPDCRGRWREFCPPAPQIPNAQDMLTTVNYLNTAKVAVLCKENYLLHGPREIVCKNGQWQSLPQCIESTQYCGPPPPISNGDISSFPLSVYPPGSTVQYRCQSFYELRGPIDVICRNGQWSEPPKCIDPCIISEGNMNKNNIQLRWKDIKKLYVKTGDFVEFECKPPYKARTSAQSFRILCREGKLEYPTCE
ncbi:complement factor H-related protein 5 isoform X1 [Ursus arctos]|uniref:complement factor H-related protein 5 isoform X1 n=2 Tax=Ursus arctos TaxID=9644 RepID=UPI001CF83C1C|nr:complement factor H-related protein 5 isoform X1 [Ursus arctos]